SHGKNKRLIRVNLPKKFKIGCKYPNRSHCLSSLWIELGLNGMDHILFRGFKRQFVFFKNKHLFSPVNKRCNPSTCVMFFCRKCTLAEQRSLKPHFRPCDNNIHATSTSSISVIS